VGPAFHQPGSSSVTAPSAAAAIAGTEVISPPSTLGMTNAQSTPMTTNPSTSEGQVKLAIDLLASAMSGFVVKGSQVHPNWWGYGMPLEFMANSSGTSQVADTTEKGSYGISTPSITDESKSSLFHNYHCKTSYWKFSNTNVPDA